MTIVRQILAGTGFVPITSKAQYNSLINHQQIIIIKINIIKIIIISYFPRHKQVLLGIISTDNMLNQGIHNRYV